MHQSSHMPNIDSDYYKIFMQIANIVHQLVIKNRESIRKTAGEAPAPNPSFEQICDYLRGKMDSCPKKELIDDVLKRYPPEFVGKDFRGLNEEDCRNLFEVFNIVKYGSFSKCFFGDDWGSLPVGQFKYLQCNFYGARFIFEDENRQDFLTECDFNGESFFELSPNSSKTIFCKFNACNFHGRVSFYGGSSGELFSLSKIPVIGSKFPFGIAFHFFSFEESIDPATLMSWSFLDKENFGAIEFLSCIFNCRFLINRFRALSYESDEIDDCKLPFISFEDSVINKKFEIKEKKSEGLVFKNVKFCAVVDFNKTEVDYLQMERVDFIDFFAFEEVKVFEKKAKFKYVTFHGHATFRGAKFFDGLDLDRANFSGEANFLDVDVDASNLDEPNEQEKNKSTRETYRLIKHSFDKIGNHLEANKYFAKEMDKYRVDLDSGRLSFSEITDIKMPLREEEKVSIMFSYFFFPWLMFFIFSVFSAPLHLSFFLVCLYFLPFFKNKALLNEIVSNFARWVYGMNRKIPVYWLNKIFSDFGQNYLLSIGWLLLLMVLYFYIFILHRHFNLLYSEPSCEVFTGLYSKVNCLASGMIPFKDFLTSGMELLSLIFYVIFAVLVWQIVVALKRHTRR